MRYLLNVFLFFVLCSPAKSQQKRFEIYLSGRQDSYPEFNSNYYGRASTDFIKLSGFSWNFGVTYNIKLSRLLKLNTGILYYRQNFTNIRRSNTLFGNSNSRLVDASLDQDPLAPQLGIQYSTDKYGYDNIGWKLGLVEQVVSKNKFLNTAEVEFCKLFTVSESYNIPGREYKSKMVLHDFKGGGYLFNFNYNIAIKQRNKWLGLGIIIPVYTRWKQDRAFTEPPESYHDKFLRGLGLRLFTQF